MKSRLWLLPIVLSTLFPLVSNAERPLLRAKNSCPREALEVAARTRVSQKQSSGQIEYISQEEAASLLTTTTGLLQFHLKEASITVQRSCNGCHGEETAQTRHYLVKNNDNPFVAYSGSDTSSQLVPDTSMWAQVPIAPWVTSATPSVFAGGMMETDPNFGTAFMATNESSQEKVVARIAPGSLPAGESLRLLQVYTSAPRSTSTAPETNTTSVVTLAQGGEITLLPTLVDHRDTSLTLMHVDIQPDTGMSGVLGEAVKSAIAGSTVKHFVTPKKSVHLNADYITFTASGIAPHQITPGSSTQIVAWDTSVGEPVSGQPLKWRVKRDATGTGPFEVKIKGIDSGAVAAQMNVWVVWCDATTVTTSGPTETVDTSITSIRPTIDYSFTVQPARIITDAERPDLSGSNTADVPNKNKAHFVSGNPLSGGASLKWDASRQVRAKILNPHLYATLPPVAGHLWNGQPAATTTPESYPTNPLEGNDDSGTGDENNNPYGNSGIITSHDGPQFYLPFSTGTDNQTFTVQFHFQEFVRLNLGANWYAVSDHHLWRTHFNFKKISGKWRNNGSVIEQNNSGW